VTILSQEGKIIMQKELKSGSTELNIGFLANGIYFIRNEKTNETIKIEKK
jgi:hypothetical protein